MVDEVSVTFQLQTKQDTKFLPHRRVIIVIASLASVNFLSSLTNDLVTVELPRMASDIELPQHLLL